MKMALLLFFFFFAWDFQAKLLSNIFQTVAFMWAFHIFV